jgi:single-strand DNA-binding protein
MAVVSGRLQIRTWKDKDGNNRKTAEIVADNVYFGGSKKEETTTNNFTYAPPYHTPASDFAMFDDDDAVLPF